MPLSPSEARIGIMRLDLEGALKAVQSLRSLPSVAHVIVDFRDLEWVEPFGMLYFGLWLKRIREERKPTRFSAANYQQHGYPAHMGFFQILGLNFGNSPGEASGSNQYVPINSLELDELRREAAGKYEEVQDVIERKADDFARLLTRETGTDLQITLTYALREVLRNVVEHSNSDRIWFAGQHWQAKNQVELVVADQGIGIRQSLKRNPTLSISSDEQALRLALKPGISGVAYRGSPQTRLGHWSNSGYGLFMTSSLCSLGGQFLIGSGTASLLMEEHSETPLSMEWQGTMLRLGIFTPRVRNLAQQLATLRREGERRAKSSLSALGKASASSQSPPERRSP